MTEDNLHTKVDLENGSPAFAKPVLYDVADFQNESPIRSTKVEFKINVKSKHVSRHIV